MRITILLFVVLLIALQPVSALGYFPCNSGSCSSGSGIMNQTPNMTASNLDTSWNLSYFLRDSSRTITGSSIRRDVNNDYLSYTGGTGGLPYGGMLHLYGGANPAQAGGAIFAVGDAAGTGTKVGWSMLGTTDTPELSMNNNKIVSLKDPTNPQDAMTLNYFTTHGAGAMINDSYYLRDTSLSLTGEHIKRDGDNNFLAIYGGDAIAGGTGILAAFGKTSGNPNAVEVIVGDAAGVGNIILSGWKGGSAPRMDMNGYNITGIRTITNATDAVNKSYVDSAPAINESYAYLPGRAGGQVLTGGTGANDDLILNGTSSATKTSSYVILQPNGGSVGFGTLLPKHKIDVVDGYIGISQYGSSNQGLVFNRYGGTESSPSAVSLEDLVMKLQGQAYNSGSTVFGLGGIYQYIDAAVSSGQRPATRLDFLVNKNNIAPFVAMTIKSNGNVSIGGSLGTSAQFNVADTVRFYKFGAGTATFDAGGNITSVSDEKFKINVLPLKTNNKLPTKTAIEKIMLLNPVCWNYNAASGLDTANKYCGLIAQDVEKIIPEAVYTKDDIQYNNIDTKTKDGEDMQKTIVVKLGTQTKSIDEKPIIGTMVLAMQEQQVTIEAQQKEIDSLKVRLDKAGI